MYCKGVDSLTNAKSLHKIRHTHSFLVQVEKHKGEDDAGEGDSEDSSDDDKGGGDDDDDDDDDDDEGEEEEEGSEDEEEVGIFCCRNIHFLKTYLPSVRLE